MDRNESNENKRLLTFLMPYIKPFMGLVLLALMFLVLAKVANIGVPLVMKRIVDGFSPSVAVFVVPVALLVVYGALRFLSSIFTELRDILSAKITIPMTRNVMNDVFAHLLDLSMGYHASRQTGRLIQDVQRGQQSIVMLTDMVVFTLLPTIVETLLVLLVLMINYDKIFVIITFFALVVYFSFTFSVTEWRTKFRRQMNEYASRTTASSTDSLMNYETTKYFGNEDWERARYDKNFAKLEKASIKSQLSISVLNLGQGIIITLAIAMMMWQATAGVVNGTMSIGDLVLVNALLIQLYVPLSFLGVNYRMIRQAMTDMENLYALYNSEVDIKDKPGAPDLKITSGQICFDDVAFQYDSEREILNGISFGVEPGQTIALVGPSGAGKSTISKLLFRFYDVNAGSISIDGQNIRDITQRSLRKAIGIVPQDTVLFNDTIGYNIAYGRTDATQEEIEKAARMAQLYDFIMRLPKGFETMVGERGVKLSGGERQRVAIARTLLKNPLIYVFDEATSSLDSASEKQIQASLDELALAHTTLIIAHRLSTVVKADEILVIEHGKIAERGTHAQLLRKNGLYAKMWSLQQAEKDVEQASKDLFEAGAE